MAEFSATIRTYLLSHMTDKDDLPNGYGVNNVGVDGNYYSRHEIIDKTFSKFWDNIHLSIPMKDEFKKDFCNRFYNREIGFEVFAQFFTNLEAVLNAECFNLLKLYDEISEMPIDEMLQTIDIKNTGEAEGDSKGLAINSNTPENDLSIVYDQTSDKKTIEFADALQEQYGNNKNSSESHTTGWSQRSKFEMLNFYAQLPSIKLQIFEICEKRCFLQIF